MGLKSFSGDFERKNTPKPNIYVLEVRDKNSPNDEPKILLAVEREEVYQRDDHGEIWRASINIRYEPLVAKCDFHHRRTGNLVFSGGYSRGCLPHTEPTVSLTSDGSSYGAIFLDPSSLRGQRIGTYLMNEIVAWAKQWPDATVQTIRLLEQQADVENKARRNRFYEQFGIVFDYSDVEKNAGKSKPMLVSELTTVDAWKQNIRELKITDFIGDMLFEKSQLKHELSRKDRGISYWRGLFESAAKKPFRWAVMQTWNRLAPTLSEFVILLILGAVFLSAIRGSFLE